MKRHLCFFLLALLPLGNRLQAQELEIFNAIKKGPLEGFTFNKRLATQRRADHLLLFTRDKEARLIGWTTGKQRSFSWIPSEGIDFLIQNTKGKKLGKITEKNNFIAFPLDRDPKVFIPEKSSELLQLAAGMEQLPLELHLKKSGEIQLTCKFTNVLSRPILITDPETGKKIALAAGQEYLLKKTIRVERNLESLRVPIGILGLFQVVTINIENPVNLRLQAQYSKSLELGIENPSGEPLQGILSLEFITENDKRPEPILLDIALKANEKLRSLSLPIPFGLPLPAPVRVSILQKEKGQMHTLASTPAFQFIPFGNFIDIDDKGLSRSYALKSGTKTAPILAGKFETPWAERGSLLVEYNLSGPQKHSYIAPQAAKEFTIPGKPSQMSMWIMGDASENLIGTRYFDSTGKSFESPPILVDWKGWRCVYFKLDHPLSKPPLFWDAILTIRANPEKTSPENLRGILAINAPTLIYKSFSTAKSPASRNNPRSASIKFKTGQPFKFDIKDSNNTDKDPKVPQKP